MIYKSDGKTPISKKAYKKLQKDKEKAERKSATATKLAAEKAERESNVVSFNIYACMWNRHKDKNAHIEEIYIGLFG